MSGANQRRTLFALMPRMDSSKFVHRKSGTESKSWSWTDARNKEGKAERNWAKRSEQWSHEWMRKSSGSRSSVQQIWKQSELTVWLTYLAPYQIHTVLGSYCCEPCPFPRPGGLYSYMNGELLLSHCMLETWGPFPPGHGWDLSCMLETWWPSLRTSLLLSGVTHGCNVWVRGGGDECTSRQREGTRFRHSGRSGSGFIHARKGSACKGSKWWLLPR